VVNTVTAVQRKRHPNFYASKPQRPGASLSLLELLEQIGTAAVPPLTAVLGMTDDERPLLMRLPAPTMGSVLVMGDRQTGKTELLRTCILSLALTNPQRRLQFALLDPKGGLENFADLPHLLTPIVAEPEAAVAVLEYILELRAIGPAEPAIVVVIDDAAEWGDELMEPLSQLAQFGAELNVYLVCTMSKPAGALWQAIDWFNFVGLFGQMASAQDRREAGAEGVGIAKLPAGEFVAIMEPDLVHFRGAVASEVQIQELSLALWEWSGAKLVGNDRSLPGS